MSTSSFAKNRVGCSGECHAASGSAPRHRGFDPPRRGGGAVSREIPRTQRRPLECSLEALPRGQSEQAISDANCEHGYRVRAIARVLGGHYSTVSRRLKAQEARTRPD